MKITISKSAMAWRYLRLLEVDCRSTCVIKAPMMSPRFYRRLRKRPVWPRNLFLLTRRLSGAQKSTREPYTPAFFPTKPSPVPQALSQLSTPVGESGDPSLGLRPGRGAASSFAVVPALFPLHAVLPGRQRWACFSSHCRLGSGGLPMTEELWLIHVTEPVTETIS